MTEIQEKKLLIGTEKRIFNILNFNILERH